MKHRLAGGIYRLLLYIVPSHLRRSHGQEMQRLFVETLDMEKRRLGWWAYPYVWSATIGDVVTAVGSERLRRIKNAPVHRPSKGLAASNVVFDIKYAIRGLVRNPGFTAMAVLTLALGIAANTAIFSVVNNVVFVPLAYDEPDGLVRIYGTFPSRKTNIFNVSAPDARDWDALSTTMAGIAVLDWGSADLTGRGDPEVVRIATVSANFFALLGSRPAQGRLLHPDDGLTGNDRVVVISDGFWRRRFAGDEGRVRTQARRGVEGRGG